MTAFITLASAGCSPTPGQPGRLALDPTLEWQADRLTLVTGIRFEPGAAMREALERGVALEIELTVQRQRRLGPIWLPAGRNVRSFRIRSLPLTRQWLLETDAGTSRYARLWLLLEALSRAQRYATGLERADLARADWRIQAAARFDRSALPAPMHLPTLFSSQWRLASPTFRWPIEAS